jgi:hypothetical protein
LGCLLRPEELQRRRSDRPRVPRGQRAGDKGGHGEALREPAEGRVPGKHRFRGS